MPRDNDKDNDSRGRRNRPGSGQGRAGGGKGRSGAARGPEKKFAKRGFAGKGDGDKPYAGKRDRDGDRPPRRDFGDRPQRFNRDDDRPRGDRPFSARPPRGGDGEKRSFKPREDRGGDKRPYTPRGDRPNFNRDDRPPRRDRDDARPAARFGEKKFGDKRPYTPREDRGEKRPYTPRGEGFRKDGDRPRGDRPERKFGGDKKFSSRGAPRDRKSDPGDRGPRKNFGDRPDRGDSKPWQKRDDRGGEERPRFSRSREDRPKFDRPRFDRPKFDRPRQRPEGRTDWQEHPRSEAGGERPRRENEDDSKIFAKRPAFGGRGAYRERRTEFEKRGPQPPKVKKSGERIAKVVSRAGLASRRDAEEWITQGRVSVNGRVINSPALDVTANDAITVDGKPLPAPERTRLFMYHKPRGLMTTHADPEGRPTVFDHLPDHLPRLISIGRLDFNTEGLLLLTNDGGLARALELPDTGWLRRD